MKQTIDELAAEWAITQADLTPLADPICKNCHGRGYIEDIDWVPYGSTTVAMAGNEVCDCIYDSATAHYLAHLVANLGSFERGVFSKALTELLAVQTDELRKIVRDVIK